MRQLRLQIELPRDCIVSIRLVPVQLGPTEAKETEHACLSVAGRERATNNQ